MRFAIAILNFFILGCEKPIVVSSSTIRSAKQVELIADTTVNGIWDLKGKVLSINNFKIKGNGTIQNADIDASVNQVIFDTSINLKNITTAKTPFSCVWYGASPNNPDNYWNIQKSINVCIDNNLQCFLPGILNGIYNYSKTIEIKKIVGNAYQYCAVHFFGDASYWANGKGSMLKFTGSTGPAFNMQLNKGSEVDHIGFIGPWRSPVIADTEYFNLTEGNYKDINGLNDSLVGLAIDYYQPFDRMTRNGSSGNKIHDISTQGFAIGIGMTQNLVTQNNDATTFDHINFVNNHKYGVVSGQPQEKGIVFTNIVSWGRIYNVVNIGWKGAAAAGDYTFDYANIAGYCIEPFNISISQWFSTTIDHWYVENIRDVGRFYAAMPLNIYNSTFELNLNISKQRNVITANSNYVNFNHCTIRYYDGIGGDIWVKGIASFDAQCFFGNGSKIIYK